MKSNNCVYPRLDAYERFDTYRPAQVFKLTGWLENLLYRTGYHALCGLIHVVRTLHGIGLTGAGLPVREYTNVISIKSAL